MPNACTDDATQAIKSRRRASRAAFHWPLWTFLWLAAMASALPAPVTVNIGGTPLVIPTPTNFAPVTPKMEMVNTLLDSLVPPSNTRLTAFIAESEVGAATQGLIPDLTRSFSVQTLKQLSGSTVTKADFDRMKSALRKQMDQMMQMVEKQAPGLMENLNKNRDRQFAGDVRLKSLQSVPFPPHEETERSLAFSMIVNSGVAGASGKSEKFVSAVTGTMVHLKGKILYLYATGDERDLTWTRKISKGWVAAVVAANPSDSATALKETAGPVGFSFMRSLRKIMIGALIGGVFGAFGFWMKTREPA